jgi:hypothetical protein
LTALRPTRDHHGKRGVGSTLPQIEIAGEDAMAGELTYTPRERKFVMWSAILG